MAALLHLGDTQDRSVQDELQFEYLKDWISSVHHRMVSENVSCPFKSLALGISHAYKEVTESQIRATLIETYLALDEAALDALARKKLQHEISFFYVTRFRDVEEVKKYWRWYLYCLSFESWKFEDTNFPEKGTVVKIPMDYIDLQVLAISLQCKIGVSHLDSPALRFNPRKEARFHLDLVHHKSRWAAILGRKSAVRALHNQLVILQGLDGSGFQSLNHKAGYVLPPPRVCVEGSDAYWVNVGQQCLPMLRHHLHVINGSDASSQVWPPIGFAKWQGPALGQAHSFRGIPDGSVEFQLLLQLVGDFVFKRLRQKREEYLGNEVDWTRASGHRDCATVLPANCWTNGAAVEWSRHFSTERMPLMDVVNFMNSQKEQGQIPSNIGVRCPTTWHINSVELLKYLKIPLRRGLHLILRRAVPHAGLHLLFEAAVYGEQQKGWVIADLLCLWEVMSPMRIAEYQGSTQMLEIEAGTLFYVTELLENGWANTCQWTMDQDLAKRGVLHLRDFNLRPWLCVRKDDLPPTVSTVTAQCATVLPTNCWTNGAAVEGSRHFSTERMPLMDVVNFMNSQKEQGQTPSNIGVRCPTTWHINSVELLKYLKIPLRRGLHLILRRAVPHAGLHLLFEAAVYGEHQKGWVIADLLCLWEVMSPMRMAEYQGSTQMLQIEAGTLFYVTELLENGWANTCQWTMDQDLAKRGVLHLRDFNLRPWLCVRKDDLPSTVSTVTAQGARVG